MTSIFFAINFFITSNLLQRKTAICFINMTERRGREVNETLMGCFLLLIAQLMVLNLGFSLS